MADETPRKKIVIDLDFFGPPPQVRLGRVCLLPEGRWVDLEQGESIFEAAKRLGIIIPTTCGGKGTCGTCRILFPLPAPEPSYVERQFIDRADLARGVRLACRSRPTSDVTATILPEPKIGRK